MILERQSQILSWLKSRLDKRERMFERHEGEKEKEKERENIDT